MKSGDHPNLLVFCKLQTIEIGRVLPCLSKSIHICGFICIVEKCDSLWIFNKDGLVVYHPGWFYSWKTLPANDHYGSRERTMCVVGKDFTHNWSPFWFLRLSVPYSTPLIHIWASYKLSVLSVILSVMIKNQSSTFQVHTHRVYGQALVRVTI